MIGVTQHFPIIIVIAEIKYFAKIDDSKFRASNPREKTIQTSEWVGSTMNPPDEELGVWQN